MSGKRYPKREMIQYEGKWISAEHRDLYFQRMREGVAAPGDVAPFGYGGFWPRFAARLIDGILLFVVQMIVNVIGFAVVGASATISDPENPANTGLFLAVQGLLYLINIAIGIGYDLYFYRNHDATLGKMALGLKAVRADGAKMSVGLIIGRYFCHILDGLTLGIGYIIAAFDEEKRALHDRICNTRVVKTR